ncbi:hypothetical protein [Pseudomonas sp. CGJS7]|uniref:hypothetical protein n=1 Tax=Pseudomonas sp. CGJS7 TaxID=3109348 RepID=UPI00300AEE8D
MLLPTRIALATLLALAATSASADPLDACVDLSKPKISRLGDKGVLIKDADSFYRVSVKTCSDLGFTQQFRISTEKQKGRLCPTGTRVITNRDNCEVTEVEKIDEAAYRKHGGR